MTDHQLYYLLGFLGWAAHTLGKIAQREGTLREWLEKNVSYLIMSGIMVVATLVIAPGDNVDWSQQVTKVFAFTAGLAGAETVRFGYKIPEETRKRKAANDLSSPDPSAPTL